MNQKTKNVLAWVLAVLLGLNFVMSGYPKILPNDNMIRRFENWGYSESFAILIGILEMLGGLLVFIPKTAFYGALLLSVVMVGAIATHLLTGIGGPGFAIISLLIAVAVGGLRFGERVKGQR